MNKNKNVLKSISGKAISFITISAIIFTYSASLTTFAFADTTLFSDDFKNGFSAWSEHDSKWNIANDHHDDDKYAEVNGNTGSQDDMLRAGVSTVGYKDIKLTYDYKISEKLESSDHLYVEWYDGSSWHELADLTDISSGGWHATDYNLPPEASNVADFQFRFRAHLHDNNDEVQIDDVSLIGVQIVLGCTDPNATNYNPEATQDDNSCTYPVLGCTDPNATNYDPQATIDDQSCQYPPEDIPGCTDPNAINYNPEATIDDQSCEYPAPPEDIPGCMDPNALNYNSEATVDDQSCEYPPEDVCPNLEDPQETVPEGYELVDGECVLIPPPQEPEDACPNLEGIQETVPEGYELLEGICVEIQRPPVDACPNLEGDQETVPEGYHLSDGVCVEDEPGPAPPPPEPRGGGTCLPPTNLFYQCSDGQDNDQDGKIDLADEGCTNVGDDDEFNEPAPSEPTGGEVAGESTENPAPPAEQEGEVLGETCSVYLNEFIKLGEDNNPEDVKKLQIFLNEHMEENLPITGFYGFLTSKAVERFQIKYWEEILLPWVPYGLPTPQTPTGYVYKTTMHWINILMNTCANFSIPMPELP